MTAEELIRQHPIISEQIEEDELLVILNELEKVLKNNIEGDICEFGCFAGTTSLFLQRLIRQKNSKKKLFLYDSFEGLPEKLEQDQSAAGTEFVSGELMASKSQLKQNFKKASLPLPKVKKAWFSDLKERDIPKQICFAFLDGDFYQSIKDPLNSIKDRMVASGIIVIDDYDNSALPGAKKAVDEFLYQNNLFKMNRIQSSLAVLIKV